MCTDEPYETAIHMSNNGENDPIQTLGGGLSTCLDRVYLKLTLRIPENVMTEG